jgi:hypothetical protein
MNIVWPAGLILVFGEHMDAILRTENLCVENRARSLKGEIKTALMQPPAASSPRNWTWMLNATKQGDGKRESCLVALLKRGDDSKQ